MKSELAPLWSSASWATFLSASEARDRLMRIVQYVCKVLRLAPQRSRLAVVALTLEGTMTSARQTLRLLKWVNIIAKQYKLTRDDGPLTDVLNALMDLGLFGFYLLDNVVFLMRMGFVRGDTNIMRRRAAQCWLLGTVAGLLGSLWRLAKLQRSNPEKNEAEQMRDQRRALLATFRFSNDVLVAYNLANPGKISTPLVGACGSVSTAIQLYNLWPRKSHSR